MKYKVVPIEATDEMVKELLNAAFSNSPSEFNPKSIYEAAIAAAPDTGMIALPCAKIWEWSEQTFGDGLRTKGVIQHITKELKEIKEKPFDLEEWTDLILLSLDGFWRHSARNLTKQQMAELLAENINAKFAKNQARVWPDWRTLPDDVAIEHKRDDTGMIAVDKHKFEALKCQLLKVGNALYGAIGHIPKKSIIAIGADLATATEQNEREYYLGVLSGAKQALKDMEGK